MQANLPELFNSYRFIDYLLSNTTNSLIATELSMQRENCTLPFWMEAKSDVAAAPKAILSSIVERGVRAKLETKEIYQDALGTPLRRCLQTQAKESMYYL